MRTLKYAILGMLVQKSMTGYELMQQFESALCEFWSAKHSQIYPELKKLTEEGMVNYEVQISGAVMEKKLYTITEEGRKDFLMWLAKDDDMGPTPKDVFRLRVFFSNYLEPDMRNKLLSSQLVQHQLRLEYLVASQSKFQEPLDPSSDAFSDYLVLVGAIMREEASCKWLERCLDLCNG